MVGSLAVDSECAGPKVEMAQNWTCICSFHFWVNSKLETAAVSTFGLDQKLETQLPEPKSGNQSHSLVIHDHMDVLYSC